MFDRRDFARQGLAAIAFGAFARSSSAQMPALGDRTLGYGPLQPDPRGLLDLPSGFSYSIVSAFGETMDDGFAVPGKFDGMGCIPIDRDRVALIRNHELKPGDVSIGPTLGKAALEKRLAALPHFGRSKDGTVLPGGTSTIIFNLRTRRRERQQLSLVGTAVNCAGGTTPWGSWLSCEESVLNEQDVAQSHGWVFEVPATGGISAARPLKGMGRFRHEAAAIDPRTGIVYLTEDRDDSLFYRFLPVDGRRLDRGGRLQALAIVGQDRMDTRNWSSKVWDRGARLRTRWIDVTDVESPKDDLRHRGQQAGAAIFARGEGIHFDRNEMFFTCTSGGTAKVGQIIRYIPGSREGQSDEAQGPGILELFVESEDSTVLDYGDNLTVAPWGHLIVCEDRADGETNYLRGVTPAGELYSFGRLRLDTELAGACFTPDGTTMFVNAYSPGHTLAITGPWTRVQA